MTGGGATGAVGSRGDGRRASRGRGEQARYPHFLGYGIRISVLKNTKKGATLTKFRMSLKMGKRGLF